MKRSLPSLPQRLKRSYNKLDISANLPRKLIAKHFVANVSCFIRNTFSQLPIRKTVRRRGNIQSIGYKTKKPRKFNRVIVV